MVTTRKESGAVGATSPTLESRAPVRLALSERQRAHPDVAGNKPEVQGRVLGAHVFFSLTPSVAGVCAVSPT
jgi:hypothetical protein